MEKDTFGINMKEYCRAHDAAVAAAVSDHRVTGELVALHREKIRILQHERLVHLIVTVMVVFVELFVTDLALLHPELGIYPALVMLGLAVLLGFYFYHYFFLENMVQRWYRLLDEMRQIPFERVNPQDEAVSITGSAADRTMSDIKMRS